MKYSSEPPERATTRQIEVIHILTARQRKAVTALMECPTRREAAERAGIAESTLRTYFHNAEFVETYQRETREQFRAACDAAKISAPKALEILHEVAEDEETPPASRISACRTIIESALKLSERVDLLERIDALEIALREKGGG